MDSQGTMVTIYGLLGHAGRLQLPLEALEVADLEPGEEFIYNGKVYEIRSVIREGEEITLNVLLAMNQAIF
jgi:hypothetical protein